MTFAQEIALVPIKRAIVRAIVMARHPEDHNGIIIYLTRTETDNFLDAFESLATE